MRLNVLARIGASFALCTSAYLVLVIALYRGITPISQFVSLVREMIPRMSSRTTRESQSAMALTRDDNPVNANARA